MIPNRIRKHLCAALIASGALLGLASAAHAADMPERAGSAMPHACKEARQSAWFERQRQLTEGDTDPSRALPVPRECRQAQAANEAEEGKHKQVAVRVEGEDGDRSPRP